MKWLTLKETDYFQMFRFSLSHLVLAPRFFLFYQNIWFYSPESRFIVCSRRTQWKRLRVHWEHLLFVFFLYILNWNFGMIWLLTIEICVLDLTNFGLKYVSDCATMSIDILQKWRKRSEWNNWPFAWTNISISCFFFCVLAYKFEQFDSL